MCSHSIVSVRLIIFSIYKLAQKLKIFMHFAAILGIWHKTNLEQIKYSHAHFNVLGVTTLLFLNAIHDEVIVIDIMVYIAAVNKKSELYIIKYTILYNTCTIYIYIYNIDSLIFLIEATT